MLATRPTRRAVGALIAAALLILAGLLVGGKPLVTAGALIATLVVGACAWGLVPRLSGEVTRSFSPELPRVGDAFTVQIRAEQTRPRMRSGVWCDRLPAGLAGEPGGTIGGRRGERLIDAEHTLRAIARGRWSVGPLEVVTGDPFGFFTRRLDIGTASALLVAPAVVALHGLPGQATPARTTADRATSAASTQGAESLTPRDYVAGDSMRRVHWRASAHRGKLMVRQEDRLESPEATVVLCTGGEPGPAFERAVSACASVVVHLRAAGWHVRVLSDAGGSLDRGAGLMHTLAEVTPVSETPAATPGGRAATEIFIASTIELSIAKAITPPRGGTGIALIANLTPKASDALTANGWRVGSLFDGVAAGWNEAR